MRNDNFDYFSSADCLINVLNLRLYQTNINNFPINEKFFYYKSFVEGLILNIKKMDLAHIKSLPLKRYLENILGIDINAKDYNDHCLCQDNFNEFKDNIVSGKHDDLFKNDLNEIPLAIQDLLLDIKIYTESFIDYNYNNSNIKSARSEL